MLIPTHFTSQYSYAVTVISIPISQIRRGGPEKLNNFLKVIQQARKSLKKCNDSKISKPQGTIFNIL